jgi:hypothetical protein
MKTQVLAGLESMALALIFIPEPVTTFIGMGLLAYTQKMRLEQRELVSRQRPPYTFHDYYNCTVNMVRGSAIAYRISTTMQGQLPLACSTISKLYENRWEWEAYRKTINLKMKSRVNIVRPSALQPAGLLKTPVLRYQAGLIPRRVQI